MRVPRLGDRENVYVDDSCRYPNVIWVYPDSFRGIFGTSCGRVMAKCTSRVSVTPGSTGTQSVYSG